MNHITILLVILSLLSCNNENKRINNTKVYPEKTGTDTSKTKNNVDTIAIKDFSIHIKDSSKYIQPDIFIISDSDYYESKKYPFFRDDKSNSHLFLVPYTDGSITTAILCRDYDIPIPYKELLVSEGLNFNNNNPIPVSKIQSVNGIDINSRKADFINLYGRPDSVKIKNDIEILYWNLQMRESDSTIYDYRKLQPFQLNGLQFDIELHFKRDILNTLIYSYEVP